MYENSEENIGWLRYLFDFIGKDFRTMDTLTDESQGDKLIEEFNIRIPCFFLQTSPKEEKNPLFDYQPTNKQSSSEKPPTNCSNEENSSMCGQIIKTEKMTTSKQGLQVLLIAPLLALAATQNKHNPLFLNNQEEYDMILGKQGSVDDHTNLQTDKETINKMMFLKRGKKDPDEGIIKGSMSLKQQTKEPEEYSNHFKHWMLPSDDTDNSDTVSSSNSLVDDHTNLQTDKETINEMIFFPDLDYLYEGTVPWEYTQASGPKIFPDLYSLDEETQVCTHIPWEYTQDLGPQIIPDQESLNEENQVFTDVPWEYTQDLVHFLSLGSIDSEASSKNYSFNVYHQDLHQCDLVQREDEDHIIQHPSLNFGQLNDQKTGKQLSNNDENFGKLYQKFSHLVTQMATEDRKEVDLEMNCLSIDSKKVVLLL
eukprot:GFUD01013448.1.p2 GENE.GFUD01013448.1~~GFUD01013448.1.p2  ORF type:complete len:424 (-),score=98.54 GFUD01013448.1:1573-2844(-)